MRMSNFIVRDAIIPALASTTKVGVIEEMVRGLHAAGYFRDGDVPEIVKSVLRREQLGSTGIGRHIAIPHSKYAGVDRLIGTLALSEAGVPFESIDGEPVYVFVLLVSPQDRPGDHLRALENVVRTMKDDEFVKRLRQAKTKDDVWRLLDEAQPPWDR
jgi:PTS system nitrogen regulatory IIA component